MSQHVAAQFHPTYLDLMFLVLKDRERDLDCSDRGQLQLS